MANPDNIVTVSITLADASVSRTGFGTPLIMTHEQAFGPELVRTYSSTTAMVTDGHNASGATVAAATAVFAQNPRVTSLKVGRRGSTAVAMTRIMTVATAIDNTDYTVTINGTPFTVDSGASATAISIAALLVAAINGGTEPVTATDNADGTFDLVEDTAGTVFGLSHTMNLITQDDTTTDAGVATDYAAIKAEDDDFYGVLMTSSATLEIVALAAAVEADLKVYFAQTADSDCLADTAGNVAETLNTAGYNRTNLLWNMDNFDFGGAAWCGRQFPKNPGSSTYAFKSLSGVSTDVLSDTQISNLESNECNHYTVTKGFSWTLQGVMASGRFIDNQTGIDWLTVEIQQDLLQLQNDSEKIPYTQVGTDSIENVVRAVLQRAVGRDVITNDFTVTPTAVEDVSSADKSARVYTSGNGVEFSATLAGAIHKITIAGTVSA